MSMNFVVIWSIYVQCKHKNRLIEVHLPAIEKAIGQPETGWTIEKEEEEPDQFRIVTHCNLQASSKDDAIIALIKNAYALFDGTWSFSGLSTLNVDRPLYIMAGVNIKTPQHQPPAITSVMLEVEQGSVQRDGERWVCHYDRDRVEGYQLNTTQIRTPKRL